MNSSGDTDAALVARLPPALRDANGVPGDAVRADRERAAELVANALADVARPRGFRWSPCGPGWSTDLDVHLHALPDTARLQQMGWLPLDRLLPRIGSAGEGRWAVRENGRTLGALDLHLDAPPDPVVGVLARARRRGEVRLREIVELRQLSRAGHTLPPSDPAVIAAAVGEAVLGGHVLEAYRSGGPRMPPVPIRSTRRRMLRRGAARVRARRVDVAISGVDGAGKSSLVRAVAAELDAAGVPVTMVWARPGMHVDFMRRPAGLVRRLLGHRPEPGLRTVAAGQTDTFVGRRGIVGWAWVAVVTAAFLVSAHRQRLAGRGVVLYDRHLADALATLELAYPDVDRRVHEAVVRRLLPRPDLTFYLDIDAATAAARKPGDTIGEWAINRQLERYAQTLTGTRHVITLDATAPHRDLVSTVLEALTQDRP